MLDTGHWYKFTYWMSNSTDPDQLASSGRLIWIHTVCKREEYPGSAGPGLKLSAEDISKIFFSYFSLRKQALTFLAVCIQSAGNVKFYFPGKINCSSACHVICLPRVNTTKTVSTTRQYTSFYLGVREGWGTLNYSTLEPLDKTVHYKTVRI